MHSKAALLLLTLLCCCIGQPEVVVTEKILSTRAVPTTNTFIIPTTTTSSSTSVTTSSTTSTIQYPDDGLFWIEVKTPTARIMQVPVKVGKSYEMGAVSWTVGETDEIASKASLIVYEKNTTIYWNTTINEVKDLYGNYFTYSKVYSSGLREASDYIIVGGMRYYYTGCFGDTYSAARGRTLQIDDMNYSVEYVGYSFRVRPKLSEGLDAEVVDWEMEYSPEMMCTTTTLALPKCRIDIAFDRQDKLDWCGPAVVESVLKYYGINRRQEYIVSTLRQDDGQTRLDDMVGYLQDNGLYLEFYMENQLKLQKLINFICIYKYPIIVLQRLNGPDDTEFGHYRLIIGFDESYVYLQDPYRGRFKVTYEEFWALSKANKATQYDNQMIVVKKTFN
ncbi:MAG: C39 family peptidase [Candidatus Altiarchaeota archaeon]|nr:C39 family peptidase [Candidatus Altiarchaeota archaeon]